MTLALVLMGGPGTTTFPSCGSRAILRLARGLLVSGLSEAALVGKGHSECRPSLVDKTAMPAPIPSPVPADHPAGRQQPAPVEPEDQRRGVRAAGR